MPLTTQELESKLWQAADILRGQIDAADYKNYIFSILFLKRLSDRFDEEVGERRCFWASPVTWRSATGDEHEFFVPESARWPVLTGASMNLGEVLNVASHAVEEANTTRLDGVLASTNWNDESKLGSPANRERIIRSLLNHFGSLDPQRREPAGGLGRRGATSWATPMEYLINRFAGRRGQEGRRVLHATPGGAAHHRAAQAGRGDAHMRSHRRIRGGMSHLCRPVRARAGAATRAISRSTARNATWGPWPRASSTCCSTD